MDKEKLENIPAYEIQFSFIPRTVKKHLKMNRATASQVTKIVKTKPILIESRFNWDIRNVSEIEKASIESARIAIPDVDAEYWITILPKIIEATEISEKSKSVFSFSLKMSSDAWKTNKYEFDVLCETPDQYISDIWRKVFVFSSQPIDKEVVTTSEYVWTNGNRNSYILDIKVTVKFLGSSKVRSKTYDPYACNNEMLSNVRGLFADPTFSDFSFFVEDKEFKIHKNILAATSPVFMKMFTTEMEESRTNTCRVDHIKPEVFEKILECIYKGKLPDDFPAYARDLFAAADYYGLDRLKEQCRLEVHENLSAANAVEAYSLACRYNLEELKADAWEVVKRFDGEII